MADDYLEPASQYLLQLLFSVSLSSVIKYQAIHTVLYYMMEGENDDGTITD